METLQPPELEPELLDLTIRFSASLPDLLLSILNPTTATTSTLKQRIRTHLPPEYARRRIRLIHAGKALADSATLASCLRLSHSHTPSRTPTPVPFEHRPQIISSSLSAAATPGKGKGKTPNRDPPAASRLYIHCSIGDVVLSAADLTAEAALANLTPASGNNASSTTDDTGTAGSNSNTTTTPAPRGFDRLLSAGFSASEILTLRSQFLAIQAHTHTPDAMPSPSTLRDLEDQWLDNSSGAADGSDHTGGPVPSDDDNVAGGLDDMLWGAIMGFFWPVGCLCWAIREEGVWSRRRKMAVVVGVFVNAGFGGLRWMR